MICIIDYGMGNVASVANAFKALGSETRISHQKEDITQADHLVLPGVGSFSVGMKHLMELGLIPVLEEEVLQKKKPFLGICLGMQLLAARSYEFGTHEGLNWIAGEVDKLTATNLLLPHVGWNDIKTIHPHSCLTSSIDAADFYFVHSYHFKPADPACVNATCEYGESFAAVISADNILGAQFHPEKSQGAGKIFLENFVTL